MAEPAGLAAAPCRPLDFGTQSKCQALAGVGYQGLTRVKAAVARAAEQRKIPAGALWVPADQPDFEVAVQLLEPEAPDSLLSWGLLSTVFEGKEYIDPGVLDGLAAEMLKDAKTAAEWQAALRDEKLAGDPNARYLWWYRRTPYWDEAAGLLPYFRVLRVPAWTTRPWAVARRRRRLSNGRRSSRSGRRGPRGFVAVNSAPLPGMR